MKQGIEDFYLVGVSNGSDFRFNFIASNGTRSEQKSDSVMQDYMMPETCRLTRKVEIYYSGYLTGLKFFDENDLLLFQVGALSGQQTQVLVGADEQIIGFKGKLYA